MAVSETIYLRLSSPSKLSSLSPAPSQCGAFRIWYINFWEHNDPTTVVHQTTSVGLSVFGT